MILAILQARVSSTRLPGKVLKPIMGVPMLLRQTERIGRAKNINKMIVATSREQGDDVLEQLCLANGIYCFRGSLSDVLERFYQAAKVFNPSHVVRLTGDCPLVDPELIDKVIDYHVQGNYDYSSNVVEPTYPDGLDVEVMRFSVLECMVKEAVLHYQREHVTQYVLQNPTLFSIGSVKDAVDLSALRWTVDEPEDFTLIKHIYENLYPQNPAFTTKDILQYLKEHPEFITANTMFKRNEGLAKSLLQDGI
ncbi:MAG: glycosyltransferase family protein [Desulfitobacterium hafniense]|nr:glycosyltransferase family protein [Desulfitobacterium hafniense]